MELNDVRILVTLFAFSAFISIVIWAYLPSRKQTLDDEGRRILEDDR